MASRQEMAAEAKEIIGWAMDRQKPLCLPRGFEAAHLSFLLPGRLMGDFRPVVLPGSVPDVDIGGFNVLRIRGITNHRIQI
jgi:hypothetical protein